MAVIIGIVAVDQNGAIGKGGAIPWRYPSDLKFFKARTSGHACVMGRRTWLSLQKRPLPDRLNIVLSRTADFAASPGGVVLRDKEAILSLRPYLACDLFVIGGEQVYRSFLPEIERWIVTEIPLAVEDADTFMPKNFLDGFSEMETRAVEDGLRIVTYQKIA
ncbi:MAG: dihydrofolate reductase [Pyrinomonadaceae bacterium]|nr:dihydrofolate reductase [Pyrinomonadaceae bacterium]